MMIGARTAAWAAKGETVMQITLANNHTNTQSVANEVISALTSLGIMNAVVNYAGSDVLRYNLLFEFLVYMGRAHNLCYRVRGSVLEANISIGYDADGRIGDVYNVIPFDTEFSKNQV